MGIAASVSGRAILGVTMIKYLNWKNVRRAAAVAPLVVAMFAALNYFTGGNPENVYKAGLGGIGFATNHSKAHGGKGGPACDRGSGGNGGNAYADESSEAWGGDGGEGACSDRPARGGLAHIPDSWKSIPLPDGRKWEDVGRGGDGGFAAGR